MKFLTRRFSQAPEGTAALFFIQIFATLGFAVLYSTLVLYATKHLHLGVKQATTLMGVFGAFNYGLHLFGGYLGGRFLSNRNLFVGGMALQVFGCACIATGTLPLFYVGLALFLTGSGLNVTCINMMLTQRFTPEDPRREGAFLWNYAGMNVGFFVGFSVAGHFQATESYASLFIFATVGNFVAIILAFFNWRTLTDRNTSLLDATPKQFRLRQLAGIGILIGLVPVVWFMLQRPGGTETIIKGICGAVALTLIYLTVRHSDRREQRNMTAYLILTVGSLMFWSLYQMAPSGLMLFAVNNVEPDGRSREDSAAVDSEHQYRLHRDRRADTRGALHAYARARVENRYTEAVCGIAAFDGGCVSHSAARHQTGRGRRQECVRLVVHELCAAKHR